MIPLLSTFLAQYTVYSSPPWWPSVWTQEQKDRGGLFSLAVFLVSVPVFVQAPLVRQWPWLSLGLTCFWAAGAWYLRRSPQRFIWGDLLLGFSWCWLAGSIYWGWFRWEPYLHLPLESLGLPVALWGVYRRRDLIGHCFYLGSLIGTAITDGYFYLTGLIDHWRQLMVVEPELVRFVFQNALVQIQSLWALSWALALILLLLGLGVWAMGRSQYHWWAFAGALLSTILVDSLFWLAAVLA